MMNAPSHPRRSSAGAGWTTWLTVALSVSLLWGPSIAPAVAGDAPREKLDCSVYETKTVNFSVAFKVAQFFFNVIPEVGYSKRTGVAWDKVVHGTIARYVELCNRYNAGLVSKAEYEARLKDIEALYKETQEMEAKLYEATRQRAKTAGDELDEVFGRKPPAATTNVALEASVEALANRVERLDPVGQPLKPAPPCQPPDMLGAPGVHSEPGRSC